MSRRNSDDSISQSHSSNSPRSSTHSANPNVFSDEYALEPLDSDVDLDVDADIGVADGFNPSREVPSVPDETVQVAGHRRSLSRRSLRDNLDSPLRAGKNVRNSISKSRAQSSSQAFGVPTTPGLGGPFLSRRESGNSGSGFATSQRHDSYHGPTGPSHPYAMYPQGTGLGRTASLASTVRMSDRSYQGPRAPEHPYGMYPQNTVPDELPVAGALPTIPVGFNSQSGTFIRRLGPDVEDADDIIGPDGHTEQLPPYTRYPEGAAPNTTSHISQVPPVAGTNTTADSETQASAIQPLTVADPVANGEHDVRVESSRSSINPPPSRLSSHTTLTENSAAHINAGGTDSDLPKISEKELSRKERWKKRANARVCNTIPLWLLVAVILILVLGAFMAGILAGGVLRSHRPKPSSGASASANATSSDLPSQTLVVVTTTTVVDATPVTVSHTTLPSLATGSYQLALSTPTESSSKCLKDSSQGVAWACATTGTLAFTIQPSGTETLISMTPTTTPGSRLSYGPQLPQLTALNNMQLMMDLNEQQLGPAMFFQEKYDKVVILHEDDLSSGSSKRDLSDSHLRRNNDALQPKDQPWFCYWNGTVFEGFIYLTQNETDSGSTTTTTTSATTSSTSSVYQRRRGQATTTATSTSSAASAAASYDMLIKVEERRTTHSQEAYCQQMQINDDGSYYPKKGSDGNTIVIELSETESVSQDRLYPLDSIVRARRRRELGKRVSSQGCICQWFS